MLRASGKRFRRQYNPNDWESSILTVRHNVLCLGMSYPSVDAVLSNQQGRINGIFHSAPSVERCVELVLRNILSQIDGRDLARVVALEADNDILAYTVSVAEGSSYDQRHLNANFNSRTLVEQMHKRWGKSVRFRQVILDYFWSPSGSWAINHWQRSFFNDNIPRFVVENLLNFGDLEKDYVFVSAKEANVAEDYVSSTAAVVYLPFCSHCLIQVVACYDRLSQFYAISFLRKDELEEHTLWKATNTISPASMKGWLAKSINQEDIYCTLDEKQIKNSIVDDYVTKEAVLEVFRMIARSGEVRMIKLTALVMYHPNYPKSDFARWTTPTLGVNKGGFVGLNSGKHCAVSSCAAANKAINRKYVNHQKKRSHLNQQLDKVGSRKRGKRDDSAVKRAVTSDNPDIALQADRPSERSRSSLESEYAERLNLWAGIVVPVDQRSSYNETTEDINGPLSFSDSAHMTQTNPSHESTGAGRKELKADEVDLVSETTPSVNDVVMGENYHSHPGNVQFFNALNSCGLDCSMVADCFADALKLLDPPGRFLVRDEWNACWAVIDDDRAIALVAAHLVDYHTLNRPCDANRTNESPSQLSCALQRLYHDKNKLGGHRSNVSELSDTSITDSIAISSESGWINEAGDASLWAPIVSTLLSDENSNNEGTSTCTRNSQRRSRTDEGMSKRSATRNKRNRSKAGKSSALALALAEFEATHKTDNSDCTGKLGNLDADEGEASLACSEANDDCDHEHGIAKSSMAVSVSTTRSWLSLVEELAESTVLTATATTINTSESVSVAEDNMTSANNTSAEAATFRCLAEWLQPSIGCTQANIASIKIALGQVSDRGKFSVYQLLTHAFEEETSALRSLCTTRK
ncbi:hypothetical protein ACHAW5_004598 [Stephanodiscus triporus]|uniref:Uncharacterized protein n=1 Tax=Stephanodiscus triporus TaxID=2934178 RepID=A0ABD3P992_9STRA